MELSLKLKLEMKGETNSKESKKHWDRHLMGIGPSWNQAILLLLCVGALADLDDDSNVQKPTLQRPLHCQRQLAEDTTRSRQGRAREDSMPSIDDWL